jgi:predicted ATP pyrophosphatase (TIGR00289 family)
VSGGKDSMLALHKVAEKHEIVCLVGVMPENIDSFMYHTPNLHLLDAISVCLEKPIYKIPTKGEEEKEVDDLINALEHLKIDGIVIGGIESEYQRKRFKRVADELGVEMVAPLWHVDPKEIMEEVVEIFDTIIVKVSAMGLDESWLGRKIDRSTLDDLIKLNREYRIHLAGEGGEFETLVLDAPLYKKRIVIKNAEIDWRGCVGTYRVLDFEIVSK